MSTYPRYVEKDATMPLVPRAWQVTHVPGSPRKGPPDFSDGNVRSLRPPVKIDQYYMCVVPELIVERYMEPQEGPVERLLQSGDVVRGVLTAYSVAGTFRMQLDDGWWTTMHTVQGEECLTKCWRVDQWYIRVRASGGILRVRTGLELCTPQVGAIQQGELVHGVLLCRSSDGSMRLKLDDTTWSTVQDMDGNECLRKVARVSKNYVCVVGMGVNVRRGIELSSNFVRTISHQDQVHGDLLCKSSEGSLRLRLDDGTWTTVKDKDGQEGLREVGTNDFWYNFSWPLGGIIGKT